MELSEMECRCQAIDVRARVVAEAPITLTLREGEWRGSVRLEFDAYVTTCIYRLLTATGGFFAEKKAPDVFENLWPGDAVEIDWRVEPKPPPGAPAWLKRLWDLREARLVGADR